MRLRIFFVLALVVVLPLLAVSAYADQLGPDLSTFAILGGAGVMINGTGSVIVGNVGGCCNAIAVTGVIPTNFTISGGTVQMGGATAAAAQGELTTTALTTLAGLGALGTSVGGALNLFNGGCGLGCYNPGAYTAATSLTGTIVLNDHGIAGSQFIFYTGPGAALTTASSSQVDASSLSPLDSVYWVVGSSATLGSNSTFAGNILAVQSIQLDTNVTDTCGRLLTEVASVTLAGNDRVGIGCGGTTGTTGGGFNGGGGTIVLAPEPGTFGLLSCGLLAMFFLAFRKTRVSSPSLSC